MVAEKYVDPIRPDLTLQAYEQFNAALVADEAVLNKWQDGTVTMMTREFGATLSLNAAVGDLIVTTQGGAMYGVRRVSVELTEMELEVNPGPTTRIRDIVVALPPINAVTAEFVRPPDQQGPPEYWHRDVLTGADAVVVTVGSGLYPDLPQVLSVSFDPSRVDTLDSFVPNGRPARDRKLSGPTQDYDLANPFDSAEEIIEKAAMDARGKLTGYVGEDGKEPRLTYHV